jgi:hypothetical protein
MAAASTPFKNGSTCPALFLPHATIPLARPLLGASPHPHANTSLRAAALSPPMAPPSPRGCWSQCPAPIHGWGPARPRLSRARLLPKCSVAPWPNSSSRSPVVTLNPIFLFSLRRLKLEVEEAFLCLWQVGPGQMWVCWKFQSFVLCSKIHISSFRAPKIVKFVLFASLWNALTSGSIYWYVLVEKFFCRNSYSKTGLENKRTCFSS